MRRTAVSCAFADAHARLEEACRLLESADEHAVILAGRRFQEAAALLECCHPSGREATRDAVLLRRTSARAGKLLDALGRWRNKLALLLSDDDAALPGYTADGRTTAGGAPGALRVLG